MKRNDWLLVGIAVILAVVAATYIWPDTVGEAVSYAVDSALDTFVVLTTSEEMRLQRLEPETQQKVRDLLATLQSQGMTVYVGQTFRSPADEQAAIDSGHSAVKTHSWHESGRAVDLYPVDPDTHSADLNGVRDDLFIQMQQAAVAMGFHQIAYDNNWQRVYHTNSAGKKFWDGGHVEWHGPYANATDAFNDYVG